MRTKPFAPRPLAVGACLLCLSLASHAQQARPAASGDEASTVTAPATESGTRSNPAQLDRVVTTGNPLHSETLTPASNVLTGDALTLTRGSTLGDTLQGLPGVGATYFGPNSSRPTIRGLDGDRVRMLSNAGASVDASSLSFDHAIPVDPLVVDRIEVLRGAAALMYGGNAIGGVVNTMDNRIPRAAQPGLGGAAELRLGGPANERNAAVVLDGGVGDGGREGGFAWHADLSGRRASDTVAPRFDSQGDSDTRIRNSAADSWGGALGGSVLFSQGYAGLSFDDYHTHYGVTVEPDTKIRMQRQHLAAAGEWRDEDAPIRKIRWQLGHTRYEHAEIEGSGEVGTVFNSRGDEIRVEAEHRKLGPVHGLVGVQWERSSFSALGEEALVPGTHTRSGALFVLEEYDNGAFSLSAGGRVESVRIRSDGDADAAEPKFGPASSRSFSPTSLSLSSGYKITPELAASASLTSSERAPMFYELLANGVHVASGAYERGDAKLPMEKAAGIDLGLKWQDAQENMLRVNIYQTRFSRFIALEATGAVVDNDGESFPEYQFSAVPALLRGFELEGRWSVPTAWTPGAKLALTGQLDGVRGTNRATDEALPRLAPLRASIGVDASRGPWSGRFEWRLAARQDRVPATDTATAGYGIVKLSLARQFRFQNLDALWYLKLDNLGNKLAYSATTVATMRDLAPLAGRSLATGLQIRF